VIIESKLESMSHNQKERLAYIEFRLYFLGEARRADLAERFQIAGAAATRDFATYKDLAPDNWTFESTSKSYRISNSFRPIFQHTFERVVTALSQGFGDGLGAEIKPLLPCQVSPILNKPSLTIVSAVTRAINLKRPLSMQYHSKNSGLISREIVPFALVDSGLRWHVRAYDRKNKRFGDFVLTRMSESRVLESEVAEHETAEHDDQWNRKVDLPLVPHPNFSEPEMVALDFDMKEGELILSARAALAGYLLRHWFVDCSVDHSVKDNACFLWLRDPLVLYGVESASLAPGYVDPKNA